MVSLDNLPPSCLFSNQIAIDITHEGVKRSFKRIGAPKSRDSFGPSSRSSYIYWAGEDASDGSTFNFVQNDNGSMAGSMLDLKNHNVVQFHNQNGVYTAIVTASKDFPPEGHPVNPPDLPHSSIFNRKLQNSQEGSIISTKPSRPEHKVKNNLSATTAQSSSRKLYDDSGGNLDVMVVWTLAAECKAYGLNIGCTVTDATKDNMQVIIDLAVEETNAAYAASGVNTELLLVHSKRHSSYVESSFSQSLDDLYNNVVTGVHEDREKYGADIVALLIEDAQYCGLGYIGPADYLMFSVTGWSCATGYYSFGHEIGECSVYNSSLVNYSILLILPFMTIHDHS